MKPRKYLLALLLSMAISLIFLVSATYLARPIVISTSPEFTMFRSLAFPIIKSDLTSSNRLSSTQKAVIQKHLADVIDVLTIHIWNAYYLKSLKLIDRIARLNSAAAELMSRDLARTTVSMSTHIEETALDLSNTHILRFPTEAIPFFHAAISIDLRSAKISRGVEALEVLPHLQALNLAENRIEVFPDFSKFKSLTYIILNSNPLLSVRVKSLGVNKVVRKLSLRYIKPLVIIGDIEEAFPNAIIQI